MGYFILDKDGNNIGHVDTSAEATALLNASPPDIYTFFVGGAQAEVDQFMLNLNDSTAGLSFFERLAVKYGRVPTQINPFEEIKDAYLKHNTFFIKLRHDQLTTLAGKLFNVLKRTVSAGSFFFVILEKSDVADTYELSNLTEALDVWYAVDTADTGASVSEHVLAGTIS
jgi:hypothetical protein